MLHVLFMLTLRVTELDVYTRFFLYLILAFRIVLGHRTSDPFPKRLLGPIPLCTFPLDRLHFSSPCVPLFRSFKVPYLSEAQGIFGIGVKPRVIEANGGRTMRIV